MTVRTTLVLILVFILSGCEIGLFEGDSDPETIKIEVPAGFDPVPIPENNSLTEEKIALGRRLFSDPILSKDYTTACISCHNPENAYADIRQFSVGVNGRIGERNSPSLINKAYFPAFFWDGGSFSLEQQVIGPLENHLEMDLSIGEAINRLQAHPDYIQLFDEVFDREPDVAGFTKAIAAFERTLVSSGSNYDAYQNGDLSALTSEQLNGLALFEGKAGCNNCHNGFLFSNMEYRNNGLNQVSADSGRARITTDPMDSGKFMVPSLRNVAITAPYMHDGRFASLEAVIDHYTAGGTQTRNQDPLITPKNLSDQEKEAIIAFLGSLTDDIY